MAGPETLLGGKEETLSLTGEGPVRLPGGRGTLREGTLMETLENVGLFMEGCRVWHDPTFFSRLHQSSDTVTKKS